MFCTFSAYVKKSESHMQQLMTEMVNLENRMDMLDPADPIEGDYFFNNVYARRVRLECALEKPSNELSEFFDSFEMFAHFQPRARFAYEVNVAKRSLAWEEKMWNDDKTQRRADNITNSRLELEEAMNNLEAYSYKKADDS